MNTIPVLPVAPAGTVNSTDPHGEVLLQLYYFRRTQAQVAEMRDIAKGTAKFLAF